MTFSSPADRLNGVAPVTSTLTFAVPELMAKVPVAGPLLASRSLEAGEMGAPPAMTGVVVDGPVTTMNDDVARDTVPCTVSMCRASVLA